jgi:hypothetical protein
MKNSQKSLRAKQLDDEFSFCENITLLIPLHNWVFLQAR